MNMGMKLKRYKEYKDSGVEWLGEIPEHWALKPLKAISRIKSITNSINKELLSIYLDKGVIRFSDVTTKRTNVTSEDLSKYQLVNIGDFVLNNQQAWRGSVGVSMYEGIVSPAYLVIELSKKLNEKYANYLLRSSYMVYQYVILSRGVGSIQRNLYWQHLKNSSIFFPSLSEQKRIATYLDQKTSQIDKAITQKERIIELLKERKQILINKAVTRGLNPDVPLKDSGIDWIGEIPEHWQVSKVKHCTSKISKGTTPTTVGGRIIDEGPIRFIKAENIQNGIINDDPLHFIDEKTNKIIVRSELQVNDVLCVIAGATLGKVAIIKNEILPANTNQAVCFLRPNSCILPQYLSISLIAKYIYDLIWLDAVQSAQPNLSMENLGNFPIFLPPLFEQQQIAEYIENNNKKINSAITQKHLEIEKLREYKATLIDSAVTGKICLTDN